MLDQQVGAETTTVLVYRYLSLEQIEEVEYKKKKEVAGSSRSKRGRKRKGYGERKGGVERRNATAWSTEEQPCFFWGEGVRGEARKEDYLCDKGAERFSFYSWSTKQVSLGIEQAPIVERGETKIRW